MKDVLASSPDVVCTGNQRPLHVISSNHTHGLGNQGVKLESCLLFYLVIRIMI